MHLSVKPKFDREGKESLNKKMSKDERSQLWKDMSISVIEKNNPMSSGKTVSSGVGRNSWS